MQGYPKQEYVTRIFAVNPSRHGQPARHELAAIFVPFAWIFVFMQASFIA
jgi:hypothetical protein